MKLRYHDKEVHQNSLESSKGKSSSKCKTVTEVMLYVENVPINAPLKLVIKKRNLLFVLYIDCIES